MMNEAWKHGVPTTWKTSRTILIPKAKRETYNVAKSWRPIQLQSILAKVLERVAAIKIGRLDILCDNMYGGRKKAGTTDAIQNLLDFVDEHEGYNISLTALDIEAGFDRLDMNATCEILERKDQHLGQWVRHWSFHRFTSYRFNGRDTKVYATDKGTPQGSPLSPILFLTSIANLANTDLNIPGKSKTRMLTYVDDFLVAVAYRGKLQGQQAVDHAIQTVAGEAAKAGYTFSALKCEGIHVKTRTADHTTPRLNGAPIPQSSNMRWLGYWLSKDWKWNTHMENWRAKAEKSGRAIRALTERYQIGGLNAWCTHRLIKCLILPQLTYGIEVWASVTRIQENQVVINKIIRKAYGLEKKTPRNAIYSEVGISPLDLYKEYRHNMLALRNRFTTNSTRWAEKKTNLSSAKQFIESATSQSVGETWCKMKLLTDWQEWTDACDSRYKGKPRRKYKHLRDLSRQDLKILTNMRATSGWPYQEHNGDRRQCPCLRDIITHDHLANRCGVVPPDKNPLNRDSKQKELLAWQKTWPHEFQQRTFKNIQSSRTQAAGATVNLPTSQPTSSYYLIGKTGKKQAARPCPECAKTIVARKRDLDAHARTHLPGYKGKGAPRRSPPP